MANPGEGAGEGLRAAFAAIFPGFRRFEAESGHGQAAAISLGSLTRLYAAAVKVNIHPTRSLPLWRVLRNPPVVLAQPNTSSMRLRMRKETA